MGSSDALFSALATIAPHLEVLDLEHSIPTHGLTSADPTQLPLPSQTIPLSSIKHIRLAGDAVYIAHLLNHISSPSTASLHVIARDPLGNKALVQSVAAHMSERSPFLSLCLGDVGETSLALSSWTHLGTSGDPLLKVTFGSVYSRDDMFSVLGDSGTLFTCIQELTIKGMFTSAKWANVFTRLPS
ncbi:hypothetical protein TRAPUB_8045 [Trametes pubescens]|uniref:Uncharacterized protein n=1 Tax=Trametes pubescens TaxID=154538 RepID=A0A1M2W6E9_TRAPU|nr:hypothetical protein TRAPUB_8045 [Trametes pubescens]